MNRSIDRPSFRRASTLIASILCWIWGAIFTYYGIAGIVGAIHEGGGGGIGALPVWFLAIPGAGSLLLAVANCAAGYFLLKEQRIGWSMGIVTACLGTAALLLFFIGSTGLALLGILINLAMFSLLTMNWVDLRDDEQTAA